MLRGIGASSGIGIGNAVIIEEKELNVNKRVITDVKSEKLCLENALKKASEEVEALAQELTVKVGKKEAEIMNGHMMLLADPMLTTEMNNLVESESVCSEYAVEAVCNKYADVFASMGDELMKQRATDMQDIKTRIQKIILGVNNVDISTLPSGSVIVANELTPSMTAGINPENVVGIVTELGGKTSHTAILARALEIPAVVAADNVLCEIKDSDNVIVDGSNGEVIIKPDESTSKQYAEKRELQIKEKKELQKYIGKETVTKDGRKVDLVANIGKPDDVKKILECDAEGVGLFRTEFLFMDRESMPTEEEQFVAYKKVAIAMKNKPVIIRTLDIGGDKDIPYLKLNKDENPFLGYRAVRFCLDRKEDVYVPQLKALLRASAYGNIKIMIPLVTCLEEIREVKALIEKCKTELSNDNIAFNKDIKVGIMVETAAASLMADVFAKEVDFFSIGTNDLTQYTMSVDRGNDKVSYLYSPFNPAVLRSIRNIISSAKDEGIMVGMCGEAACNPMMITILLALGLDEFSMSAPSILKSRKFIMNYNVSELQDIVHNVMNLSTTKDVKDYLSKVIK